MQVLWGYTSPQMLQHLMALFEGDLQLHEKGLLRTEPITTFADLGSRGQHPQNIWVELKRHLPKPQLPKLHYMWLPMKHNVLGLFSRNVAMILPHELFPAIYHCYPGMWKNMIYGSVDTCREFWRAVSGSEHFRHRNSCL